MFLGGWCWRTRRAAHTELPARCNQAQSQARHGPRRTRGGLPYLTGDQNPTLRAHRMVAAPVFCQKRQEGAGEWLSGTFKQGGA